MSASDPAPLTPSTVTYATVTWDQLHRDARALAWRLIAASLKAQGRASQAAEAAEAARRLDPES